ncbi:hypothetical protein DDIC_02505 [Desulfovibrio desulfuricans]|uniref:Alpha-D-phosphohexomutase alpha/beta/alpha domain-containing protein n=1 Tax=Desulfovibrio desulfuricans TaxID=876 RepID=A0A4P7UH36_DESDE|nr:hypothetical protein DDIC_02505 [Desulfovibrio desulfuricans]
MRGSVPAELNAPLTRALGRAVVEMLGADRVVIGRARLTGSELRDAPALGLQQSAAQVTDIGMCGLAEKLP